jgi:hypothetical protein
MTAPTTLRDAHVMPLGATRPPTTLLRAPAARYVHWAADRTDVSCWADADDGGVIMIDHGPGGRLDLRREPRHPYMVLLIPAQTSGQHPEGTPPEARRIP